MSSGLDGEATTSFRRKAVLTPIIHSTNLPCTHSFIHPSLRAVSGAHSSREDTTARRHNFCSRDPAGVTQVGLNPLHTHWLSRLVEGSRAVGRVLTEEDCQEPELAKLNRAHMCSLPDPAMGKAWDPPSTQMRACCCSAPTVQCCEKVSYLLWAWRLPRLACWVGLAI